MQNGRLVRVVAGLAGAGAGTYVAVAPVFQGLTAGTVSGAEAGMSLAIIAAIVGCSGAVMGSIHRRFSENSQQTAPG